jgi:hypothetical protein
MGKTVEIVVEKDWSKRAGKTLMKTRILLRPPREPLLTATLKAV